MYSLMNEVVHTSPTIGSNVEEVVWKNIHFIMWDIGGQESLRATWNTYFTNTKVSVCIEISCHSPYNFIHHMVYEKTQMSYLFNKL